MINLFFFVHDYSGARTYSKELLGWLAIQPNIVLHKVYWESVYYKEYTVTKEENIVAVHIPDLKRKGNTLEKYSRRCIDLMTPILKGKCNLIFHLNCSTQVKLCIEARKRFKTYVVFTLHYLPNYFSFFTTKNINPEEVTITGDVMDKEIASEADHIICVTHFAKKMLNLHYGTPQEKMTVIYNGCSQVGDYNLSSNNTKVNIKRQSGFSAKDRIILFVGRLQRGKGVEKLIEAFNLLSSNYKNLRLVLVGKGDFDSFMKICQNNLGKINITGKLPADKIKQLYQIADIGVIPSEFEQCSYVALEMMQNCLPIICTDAPGLKELFVNGKSALFASLRPRKDGLLGLEITARELYKVIKQILDDKALAKQLCRIAYDNWLTQYTVVHMGKATLKVYEQQQIEPITFC